jgi:hypothetical protein
MEGLKEKTMLLTTPNFSDYNLTLKVTAWSNICHHERKHNCHFKYPDNFY